MVARTPKPNYSPSRAEAPRNGPGAMRQDGDSRAQSRNMRRA